MKRISFVILFILSVITGFAQLDRTKAPKAVPATKLNLGDYTKFELKNGLKVIIVENHKYPVVSYSLSLDIDPIYEGDKAGYSTIAGDLLRAGTLTKTKAQIDEEIDFIGASLNTSSNGIEARSLKKHQDKLLELMTDVLYHPSFPQEELDKQIKQTLSGLKIQKDEPRSVTSNITSALMFGKETAYGEIVSEQTIENIKLEDCKAYYNNYFKPNVSYLVIVGDITLKEAKKTVKKYFGKWETGEVPTHDFVKPTALDKPIYALSNKDGVPQSYISISYPIDLKPGSDDYIKARVMNQVFGGGGFSSRLMKNLREDKAWTYGAYSRMKSDEYMGYFRMASNVRGAITDSAFIETQKEMNQLINVDVEEEDLVLIKNSMAGSFGRSLEDPSTLARFALNIDKYGLPVDYYETYMERLESVSVNDVKEMAKKYLKPQNAIYLAVGDVSTIEPLMEKVAGDAQITEYDYYANKVVRTGLPKGLTAQKVIKNYIDALGGVEHLQSVHDLSMKCNMSIQGMNLALNTYQKAPNKISVETLMGSNILSKQVYDGTKGTMIMQGQKKELEGDMLKAMELQAVIFPELQYEELGYSLELTGKDKLEGKDVYKMIITDPVHKEKTVYFDVETGFKVKEIENLPQDQGISVTMYSDYKDVDGVKFPMIMTQAVGPQSFDISVNEVYVNKGIQDDVFAN